MGKIYAYDFDQTLLGSAPSLYRKQTLGALATDEGFLMNMALNFKSIVADDNVNYFLAIDIQYLNSSDVFKHSVRYNFRIYNQQLEVQCYALIDGASASTGSWTAINQDDWYVLWGTVSYGNFPPYASPADTHADASIYNSKNTATPVVTSARSTYTSGNRTGTSYTDEVVVYIYVNRNPKGRMLMSDAFFRKQAITSVGGSYPIFHDSYKLPTTTLNATYNIATMPQNWDAGELVIRYAKTGSLDNFLEDDDQIYQERIDNTTGGTAGSPGWTNPTGGTFGDAIKTYFDDLAAALDGAISFPVFDFQFPWPLDGAGYILNDAFNFISESLENLSDGVIYGMEGVILSVPLLIDGLVTQIQKEFGRIPNAFHNAINIEVVSYWDLTPLLNDIFGSVDLLIPDGFVEPLLKISPPDGVFTFPANSFRIPKKLRFTLLANLGISLYYDLNLLEIPLMWIPSPLRNIMFPTSDQWFGRRAGDTRGPTFLTDSTAVGVPTSDFIAASGVYGGLLAGIGFIGMTAPNLAKIILQKLFSLSASGINSIRQPTTKDIALALHPPGSYNNDWSLINNNDNIENKMFKEGDSRLPATALPSKLNLDAVETKVDTIDSEVGIVDNAVTGLSNNLKKSYKRLYTMNKLVTRHKDDITDLATWLSSIPIVGDIDAITILLDAMINTETTAPTTSDSENMGEIINLLSEMEQDIDIVQAGVGVRGV